MAVGSVLGAVLIFVVVAVIIIACNANKRKARDKVRRPSMNRGYEPEYEMKNWHEQGSRPVGAAMMMVEPYRKETRLGSSLSIGNRSVQPMVCNTNIATLFLGHDTFEIWMKGMRQSPSKGLCMVNFRVQLILQSTLPLFISKTVSYFRLTDIFFINLARGPRRHKSTTYDDTATPTATITCRLKAIYCIVTSE